MPVVLIIREVEYAIRILAELYKSGSLPAAELSKRRNVPSPFIYRVLKKLEASGIVEIKRGPKGGYSLCRDCGELTMYDVINAFENTFLVIECMKEDYDCSNNRDMSCYLHNEFGRIQNILKKEFQRNSLEELIAEEELPSGTKNS